MSRARQSTWLGLAEALAALAACLGLILVVGGAFAFVLAPRFYQLTFELHAVDGEATGATAPQALVQELETLQLPGELRLRDRRSGTVLVLDRLAEPDAEIGERVNTALIEHGYRADAYRVQKLIDAEALIIEHARLLIGLQSVILLLFGGVLAWLRVTRAPAERPSPFWTAVLVGAGAGLVGFVASLSIGLVQSLLGLSVEEQAWLTALLRDRDSLIGLIPWIVVLVPLAEEVFFRGYLFRFLHQRSGATLAYVVSAACFSLIHFHLPGLLVYFTVGLIFAWACRRTSTVIAPVVGHMIYNGSALLTSLVTYAW